MRISDWSSDVCSSDLVGNTNNVPAERRLGDLRYAAPGCGENGFRYSVGALLRILLLAEIGQPSHSKTCALRRCGEARTALRSEERRVGKECVRTCRARWVSFP